MVFKTMKVQDLLPADYNPRKDLKSGDEEYEALKRSIQRFGYVDPVIYNKRTKTVVGGHQRIKVLKELGYEEIEAVEVDLNANEEKALNIALNKIEGDWDKEKLTELLNELSYFNMEDLTGFNQEELIALLGNKKVEEVQEDDPDLLRLESEAELNTLTRKGDRIHLGGHVVLCGDSTLEEDADKLMDGAVADLVVTDPPYNVSYTGTVGSRKRDAIENDSMSSAEFTEFLIKAFKNLKSHLKAGGSFYIWHASTSEYDFLKALAEVGGLHMQSILIWVKNALLLSRWDYQPKHELCIYGWKEGAPHYFIADRTRATVMEDLAKKEADKMSKAELLDIVKRLQDLPSTVLRYPKPLRSELHPTMKPVKLMAELIKNSAVNGYLVLDLFLGSGSTLIAAEELHMGLKCYGMEYEPKYCDVIIKRYAEYKGTTNDITVERDGKILSYHEWLKG